MLRKKDNFTVITPIPGFIPRQLAIDILHSHSEVITLNPLVIGHKPIPAPHDAETDEYYSTWYEITERIQFVPGIGKIGSSTIKFNGCFHDMPWGLQTHIYAPMNVELRNTYRIGGNQPGVEPPEIPEIGLKALGAPSDGLYLREDIEIKCNVTVHSFVKSQLKKASGEMVSRIIKKAELLDAGALQAMIEDGKLRTINPADRSHALRSPLPSPTSLRYSPSVSGSPPPVGSVTGSPPIGSPPTPYQVPRVQSMYSGYYRPGTSGSQGAVSGAGYGGAYGASPPTASYGPPPDAPQELPGAETNAANKAPAEMPGDFYHAAPELQPERQSPRQPSQSPPHPGSRESPIDPSQQRSTSPKPPLQGQWATAGSRPVSISSGLGSPGLGSPGLGSPGLEHKGFPTALAPHRETNEEYQDEQRAAGTRSPHPPQHHVPYNPAEHAKAPPGRPQYGHGQLGQRYSFAQ